MEMENSLSGSTVSTPRPRFCLRTYIKDRALKQIIQWLIVAAVSIFLLSAFAVVDAYAQAPPPIGCSYLSGESTPVNPGPGIPSGNAGVLKILGNTDFIARICEPADAPNDFELDGWMWDDNLGWISLYCQTGDNRGVYCGEVDYGVKVDLETGDMYGWAWGDNIGWISFGCQEGMNDEALCGDVNYSGNAHVVIDEDLGKFSGYAWADTVGWINLEGLESRILHLMLKESTDETAWGVWTKAEIPTGDDPDEAPNKANAPVADRIFNMTSGYDLFINIADINGNSPEPADINIDIETVWSDTVRWDQTTNDEGNYHDSYEGPVSKPWVAGLDTLYTPKTTAGAGIDVSHYAKVTSYAPTDGANCYDGNSDGRCDGDEESGDFYYRNFGEDLTPNELIYQGANIDVVLTATDETATYSLAPLNFSGGYKMEFKPGLELITVDYLPDATNKSIRKNIIEAIRNKADYFDIEGTQHFDTPAEPVYSYTVDLELISDADDVVYGWIESLEDDPPEGEDDSMMSENDINAFDGEHIAFPYAPDSELAAEIPGAALHSVVTITLPGKTTKFYSNGLPRVLDSVIINQAVEIVSGSVFSPGSGGAVEGSVITLLGDIASYTLREQILRNVSRLTAGAEISELNAQLTIDNLTSSATLDTYKLRDGQLYYIKANGNDVEIENINKLAHPEGKPVTVIVEGGDLFLNDTDTGIIDNGAWGFIVLEDRTKSAEQKGGRMYIHNNITDLLNAHIYADGPIFSYVDDVCYYWDNYGPAGNEVDGLREPNFVSSDRCSSGPGSYKEPVTHLNNQLYYRGTIASMNCIGCSIKSAPYRGDGKLIGDPSAKNFAISRLYDLNYFRYFRISSETGDPTGNRSKFVSPHTSISNKDMPFYVEYEPPPAGLPGFTGL